MSKAEKTTGRMPNAALMKPVQPDDVLAVIAGRINANEALKVIFSGKKQVSRFEMTKLVSAHVK
jgi:hypothetical protein